MNIRDTIVETRRKRIAAEGHALGCDIPDSRTVSLVPFGRDPFVICEIKRRSPSKGDIAPDLNALVQAKQYGNAGIRTISVLTEPDYFGGSLTDLLRIKEKLPGVSVLRKDFLLDEKDIEVSYRAGADAVLLIAAVLSQKELEGMYRKAKTYGMECLVEVHTREDVDKIQAIQPFYVGINSRDLQTFTIDLLHPLKIACAVNWETKKVFESGIHSYETAVTVLDAGFSGLLVGEAVVKNGNLIGDLLRGFTRKRAGMYRFWPKLATKRVKAETEAGAETDSTAAPSVRPLVKICGITNREDADMAVSFGADILGFVFAESPRKAKTELPEQLEYEDVLKVAVVVGGKEGLLTQTGEAVRSLLESGGVDAVQFHGNETPDTCFADAYPYFKAIRLGKQTEQRDVMQFRCPRVLFDAFSPKAYGGTGKLIDGDVLQAVRSVHRGSGLWLAGGLDSETVAGVIEQYSPELVDASSLLECRPGKKDYEKVKKFFQRIDNAG